MHMHILTNKQRKNFFSYLPLFSVSSAKQDIKRHCTTWCSQTAITTILKTEVSQVEDKVRGKREGAKWDLAKQMMGQHRYKRNSKASKLPIKHILIIYAIFMMWKKKKSPLFLVYGKCKVLKCESSKSIEVWCWIEKEKLCLAEHIHD